MRRPHLNISEIRAFFKTGLRQSFEASFKPAFGGMMIVVLSVVSFIVILCITMSIVRTIAALMV